MALTVCSVFARVERFQQVSTEEMKENTKNITIIFNVQNYSNDNKINNHAHRMASRSILPRIGCSNSSLINTYIDVTPITRLNDYDDDAGDDYKLKNEIMIII